MTRVKKLLVVILDTASVHTAKAIQRLLNVLRQRSSGLYVPPPYSPELNCIERLWYQMKYQWGTLKSCNEDILEADIDSVRDGLGENT